MIAGTHRKSRGAWIGVLVCAVYLAVAGGPVRADFTVIPLPEVITDPNEGTTVGFLPVVLLTTEAKTIRSIIATDVRYNDTFGVYPKFRFFDYPSPTQKYFIIAGKGTRLGEDVEFSYEGQDLFDGRLDLRGLARHEQDPFERFYGYGNHTPSSNETNWTSTSEAGQIFAGVKVLESVQAFWQPRVRLVRVGSGSIGTLPNLRNPSSGFSTVEGVGGATIVGNQFGVEYDDRDVRDIPTRGVFATTTIEIVDKALGSTYSFIKYGLEAKAFVPLRPDKKFIVALRTALNYLQHGDGTPFYEKNTVGGFHSLRAYGGNRYNDNHRFVFQGEFRTNVFEREVFGVRAHLELAPFVDLGKVFNTSREFPLEDLHPVGGLGFRAVVSPQVVGYVDFGTSGGSPSVFTGIDYPF
ncbi:MAG: surface antigen [Deltaproteobacteria bacterium]|jgi:outer membrane protein assembly factor BamA|nr:surface antigen [Deltaproteobacteria bacterium]